MGALGFLAAWLVLAVVGMVATLWWCGRLWKQRDELPAWKKGVAGIVAGAALVCGFGAALGLVQGFGAVGGESVDPSQKARILGEGIAGAMNYTALGLVVWLPGAIALAIVTKRRKT